MTRPAFIGYADIWRVIMGSRDKKVSTAQSQIAKEKIQQKNQRFSNSRRPFVDTDSVFCQNMSKRGTSPEYRNGRQYSILGHDVPILQLKIHGRPTSTVP